MSAGKKNIQDYFKVKPSEERARQSEHAEGTDGEQADSETVADDGVRMRHSQVNYLLCHHVSVHAVQTTLLLINLV